MSASSANTAQIIIFPRTNVFESTRDPGEIINRLFEMKQTAVDDALEFIVPTLLEAVESVGFQLKDERKVFLLIELLRSLMFDHFGIDHDINTFIEDNKLIIDQIIEHEQSRNSIVG